MNFYGAGILGFMTGSISTSRLLACFAVLLWLISLSQPALIIDNGSGKPEVAIGVNVLATGWLGFGRTLGWFANIPFFIAVAVLLFRNKSPRITVIIGLLLAIDTFRLEELPGGGRHDIYGYSQGVAVWFLSFEVLLLAAVWRKYEESECKPIRMAFRRPAVYVIITLMIFSLGIYGVGAYRATHSMSVVEAKFLPAGSVKRGEVCTTTVQSPNRKLILDGPLEINGDVYILGEPSILLSWGLPVVRKNGFDFALYDAMDINSVYWKRATGPAAATLNLSRRVSGTIEVFEAELRPSDGGIAVFRQEWKRDMRKTTLFCPDYVWARPSPALLPPRSLLVSAVEIPGGLAPPSSASFKNFISVTTHGYENTQTAIMANKHAGLAATDLDQPSGCSHKVQLIENAPGLRELGFPGRQVLAIDDQYYPIMSDHPLDMVCVDDNLYVYYFWFGTQKQSLLYIQRRSVPGLREGWTGVVKFDYAHTESSIGRRNLRINALEEKDGRVVADIVVAGRSEVIQMSFVAGKN